MQALKENMTYGQFLDWAAYYEINPWGPVRDDARAAFQTMHLLTPYGHKGQRFKAQDYMLKMGQHVKERLTGADAAKKFAELARMTGAKRING